MPRKLRARKMIRGTFPDHYRGFGAIDMAIRYAMDEIDKKTRAGNFEGAAAWYTELNRHLMEKEQLTRQKAMAERESIRQRYGIKEF